jgi:hypothetical protein
MEDFSQGRRQPLSSRSGLVVGLALAGVGLGFVLFDDDPQPTSYVGIFVGLCFVLRSAVLAWRGRALRIDRSPGEQAD